MLVERLLKIALLGSTWVLYLLLALSVVSLTAALERYLFFRRHADDQRGLKRKLTDSFGAEDLTKADEVLAASPSIEARVDGCGDFHSGDSHAWEHGGYSRINKRID